MVHRTWCNSVVCILRSGSVLYYDSIAALLEEVLRIVGASRSEPPLSAANGDFVRTYKCMVLYTANALPHLFQRHVLTKSYTNTCKVETVG